MNQVYNFELQLEMWMGLMLT